MEILEKAIITCPFGGSHTGTDFISNTGNRNLRALARGKVTKIVNNYPDEQIINDGDYKNYPGNEIYIEHGNGYVTRYCHIKYNTFNVNIGDIVESGTLIAVEGNSGYSKGTHVHFEVLLNGKAINPTQYGLGQSQLPDYVVPTPQPSGEKYINLSPEADTWRVYPMNVAPVVGNECKQLLPKQFGGLTYTIKGYTQSNVAIIETRDYGQVQIFIGHPLAEVTDSPKYGLVK
jgi:murein DD-endopeptidase MepM/ murein hydrolase activator NlpD